MAYLLLYGTAWTQRWQIAEGAVEQVKTEVNRVGREETGHLAVVDPGTGEATSLVVAWGKVAAAIVLGSEDPQAEEETGSYR